MQNRVKELVTSRGITPYRFWKDVGCSRDVAYRLVKDPSYIPRENVLEGICRAYGVQPGDVLIYIPDSDNVTAS
uniref:Putative transcriptional regulator, XRE family n=1 Tax=Cyanothece sp. (strain PCC 7425 / ATCC 29141) TaxID=395961 RepID=B8HYZ3_CYAP4